VLSAHALQIQRARFVQELLFSTLVKDQGKKEEKPIPPQATAHKNEESQGQCALNSLKKDVPPEDRNARRS
jgi:hypothetical protein